MEKSNTFSLDEESQNIFNDLTKEYFKEVLSSYHNGNYRATIVVLYSVVICDLIYKLQYLEDFHNDSIAKNILEEIKEIQKNNPTSSDWETKLVEKIYERTPIIDNVLYINIGFLQKHRHLCAHPVLSDNSKLFQPNKENARAHIRNILEYQLIKAPSFTNRIFTFMLEELSDKKDLLVSKDDLKKYLFKAYLEKCDYETSKYIFRHLWKLVFNTVNEECDKNRIINTRALYIIYESNKEFYLKSITDEPAYFGKFKSGRPLELLIQLCSRHVDIFFKLSEESKTLIKNKCGDNQRSLIFARFLSTDNLSHLELIKNMYNTGQTSIRDNDLDYYAVEYVISNMLNEGIRKESLDLVIHFYVNSRSYFKADKIFDVLVRPFYKQFSTEQMKQLLDGIKENHQTYYRQQSKEDHKELVDYIKENLSSSIDVEIYKKELHIDEPQVVESLAIEQSPY